MDKRDVDLIYILSLDMYRFLKKLYKKYILRKQTVIGLDGNIVVVGERDKQGNIFITDIGKL